MSTNDQQNRAKAPCCSSLIGALLGQDEASELAAGFKTLADPVRLQLLSIIANAKSGEVCACDLPQLVGRSQGTVSHHLGVLVNASIIEREQRGKWAWFRLRPQRLEELSAALVPHPGA